MTNACAVFFLSALAGAEVASASETYAGAWKAETFSQRFVERSGARDTFTYDGIKVASTNPDVPEIRFGCSERYGLTATVTFRPLSESKAVDNKYLKFRYKNSNMTIEGRETERVNWTFIKETRTVQTRRAKHAAMIYNAVVQGLTITIKEPYKKNITLIPAPIDEDFRTFASECPVTSPETSDPTIS